MPGIHDAGLDQRVRVRSTDGVTPCRHHASPSRSACPAPAHRDHMERADNGAIAASRAPVCLVQHRRLAPLRHLQTEQMEFACGNAPPAARAARGVHIGEPTRSARLGGGCAGRHGFDSGRMPSQDPPIRGARGRNADACARAHARR